MNTCWALINLGSTTIGKLRPWWAILCWSLVTLTKPLCVLSSPFLCVLSPVQEPLSHPLHKDRTGRWCPCHLESTWGFKISYSESEARGQNSAAQNPHPVVENDPADWHWAKSLFFHSSYLAFLKFLLRNSASPFPSSIPSSAAK